MKTIHYYENAYSYRDRKFVDKQLKFFFEVINYFSKKFRKKRLEFVSQLRAIYACVLNDGFFESYLSWIFGISKRTLRSCVAIKFDRNYHTKQRAKQIANGP